MNSLNKFLRVVASRVSRERSGYSILTFHSIGSAYDFSVDAAIFGEFIDALSNHGDFVPLEFLACNEGRVFHNERYFSLTFDDGHKDNLTIVAEILENRRVSATFFVGGALLTEDRDAYVFDVSESRDVQLSSLDFLALSDIRSLIDSGHLVCPHGYRHRKYSGYSDFDAEMDVQNAVNAFRKHLNIEPREYKYFAFPFGRKGIDYGMRDIASIRANGLIPFGMSPMAIKSLKELSSSSYVVPRIGLGRGDCYIWIDKALGAGRLWCLFNERNLR